VEKILIPTKTHYPSNLKQSFNPKREVKKETPNRERKLLFAYFVSVLVTWMSVAFGVRELRRDILTMLETHCDEFINLSARSYSHVLSRTSSRALPQFSHGPNHYSYGFGSQENRFVPRCFGYNLRSHRGDRFPRRPDFSA
jgi:hypothetical protein